MDLEEIATEIIANSGEARSTCMEAISIARDEQDIDAARQLIAEAHQSILKAHRAQMGLITKEAQGERINVTFLMVHAQDHVMTTMAVMDLAEEVVNLYEQINEIKRGACQK